MTSDRTPEYLAGLVRELCKLPRETEWLEFKTNNEDPREIGEYVSALANAAAYSGKAFAYLIWGIEDGTHRVVGTRRKAMSRWKPGCCGCSRRRFIFAFMN
jgi:ATP-dependent DNA helicase RecG